jgi:hypothetical protein
MQDIMLVSDNVNRGKSPHPIYFNANVVHQQYTNLPGWIKWGQHPSFAPIFKFPIFVGF